MLTKDDYIKECYRLSEQNKLLTEALEYFVKGEIYDGKIKFNIHQQAKLQELLNQTK